MNGNRSNQKKSVRTSEFEKNSQIVTVSMNYTPNIYIYR